MIQLEVIVRGRYLPECVPRPLSSCVHRLKGLLARADCILHEQQGNSGLLVRYANRNVVSLHIFSYCDLALACGWVSKAQSFEQSPVVGKDADGNLCITKEGVIRNY